MISMAKQLHCKKAEPKITVHGYPDKMSDQILNCSDVMKYVWSDITTMYSNLVQFHFTNNVCQVCNET